MSRICILAPGQPSTDPRLVKEADALCEAGYEVRVLCSHCVPWADTADEALLSERHWSCTYVDGKSGDHIFSASYVRARHWLASRLSLAWPVSETLRRCALSRTLPELAATARAFPADLYIAHYPGALVAAAEAARAYSAPFAYDAEDFEAGTYPTATGPAPLDRLIESYESQHLPRCAYVSAASPGIAQAYSQKYSIPLPATILNVFPLSERPAQFRFTPLAGPLRLYWFSQTIGSDRGLQDVLRAMGQLKDCDIELHLRGRWAQGFQNEVRKLTTSLALPDQRIQVHPVAPPAGMISLAAQYEIGLALEQSVSRNRQICLTNKIFTYLLAGNAVVATATAGQQPIMEMLGQAGFSYQSGDVNALARGLRVWYENRRVLEEARRQAWAWGTRRFNWDVEKRTFLQMVERALNRH